MTLADLIERKRLIVEERLRYYIAPPRCPVCGDIVPWIVARGGAVTCGSICGRELARATCRKRALTRRTA